MGSRREQLADLTMIAHVRPRGCARHCSIGKYEWWLCRLPFVAEITKEWMNATTNCSELLNDVDTAGRIRRYLYYVSTRNEEIMRK